MKINSLFMRVLHTQGQTYNLIPTGDMESGGWTAIPGNTNLNSIFEAGTGIDSTTCNLKRLPIQRFR